MRLTGSSFAVVFAFAAVTGVFAVSTGTSGCSSNPRPAAGNTDEEGRDREGGTSIGDGGGDAALAETCANTIRDGNETDVDCGGNVCAKCIDGKACIANTDCSGGACLDKVCATPACTNIATDGDETDTDCGGTICPKCTTGKRCKEGRDCVSGACVNSLCRCPQGMIEVSRAGGNGAYCIDEIEVTKFQYNKFITANVPISEQIAVCKPPTNASFVPRGAWPPAVAPPYLQGAGQGLAFNSALPVHYVDWCDAYAYCKWANKQLCGGITGGSVDFDKASRADSSAWYNACSAQGAQRWPYADTFDSAKCNGGEGLRVDAGAGGPRPQYTGYGFGGSNQDLGLHYTNNSTTPDGKYTQIEFAACHGGAQNLYHMSGNAAEWEDSCDGTTATANCRVRGGSYKAADDPTTLGCPGGRVEPRVPAPTGNPETDPLADVGFRCCLY